MDVDDFAIDEVNEDEFARHHVTVREVLQVLDGDFRVFRNGGQGNASHIIVGLTYGGRLWKIPVDPTPTFGVWRPRTAFDAPAGDRTRYEQ